MKAANRDFLMCKPSSDLQGFSAGMLRYVDTMSFSRALNTDLPSQRLDDAGKPRPLVTPSSSAFWSERSERVTAMSWALAEVPKEVVGAAGVRPRRRAMPPRRRRW